MNPFDQMLSTYEMNTNIDQLNAIHEVMQQITLSGLYNGGFFDKAAFYGGTCLRIFHGLNRFSEDMDFSLLSPDESFSLTPYFDSIVSEFTALGQQISISTKNKTKLSAIQSAFLKSDTTQYNINLKGNRPIKIKIEIDTNPPLSFSTEQKLLLQPFSFYTHCFTLPDLFAGKMHALLYRTWQNRVKGRDWYDFEWYIKKKIPLNLRHFNARAQQSGEELAQTANPEQFLLLLQKKIKNTSISQIIDDVRPFIKDPSSMNIWTPDYFLHLASLLKFQ